MKCVLCSMNHNKTILSFFSFKRKSYYVGPLFFVFPDCMCKRMKHRNIKYIQRNMFREKAALLNLLKKTNFVHAFFCLFIFLSN